VFPAGPLRETPDSAFARADAVCIIGPISRVTLPHLPASLPRFDAGTRPDQNAPALAGKKVIAFAGIGRPEKFFRTLRDAGAVIVTAIPFADHHPYSAAELAALVQTAAENDCALVTTVKDHMRVPVEMQDRITPYPVCLTWRDDAALQSFLLERAGLQ